MVRSRTVVCQEWLTTYGGSELVASELADLLEADRVLTFAAKADLASELFPGCQVLASRIGRTQLAQDHWQWFLPVMPYAWSRFDLGDASLVVTSSHACSNAIRAPETAVRVSYCHTPMRYAWYWREEIDRFPRAVRPVWPLFAAWFRERDRAWSSRVHSYIANSRFTADRIFRAYGRRAKVIHPPVDTEFWTRDEGVRREGFFLLAGRLVAYKRPQEAIAAAAMSGRRLVVAGDGPMRGELQRIAPSNVEFVIKPSREELRSLYRRAEAIVYPQVEEFGITLVEAASCGTPCIAVGKGGALDTVRPGVTGLLVGEGAGLAGAMRHFEGSDYDARDISEHARSFGIRRFRHEIGVAVCEAMERYSEADNVQDRCAEIMARVDTE